MTIKEINAILQGNFVDPADREYWQKKREELQEKEHRSAENQKYFDSMVKYDR